MYRSKNRKKAILATKKWRDDNKKHRAIYWKKYRAEHKKSVNENFRRYIQERKLNDKEFAIKQVIRSRFKAAIRNGSWRSLFESTEHKYHEYVSHFECSQPRMFDRYLNESGLNIDHIIPVAIYDFTNKKDVLKCWSPRNLRIITSSENYRKKDKVDFALIEKHGIIDLLPEGYKNV